MSVPKTKATNMHVRIVAFVLLSCMLQPQWCSSTSAKWPDGNARGGSSAMVDSLRRSCRACLRSNHVGLSMRLRGGEEVRMEQVQAGSQGGNSLAKSRLEKMSEQILSRESKYQSDCSVASRDNIDRTRDIVGKHYHDHSHANAHQVQDKIDHQPDYNDLHQMSWCSRSSDASQNEMGLTSNPEQKVGMETLRLERGVSFEEEEVELKQTPAEEQAVLQQPTHVCGVCGCGIDGMLWVMAGNERHCSFKCAGISAMHAIRQVEYVDGRLDGDSPSVLFRSLDIEE